VNRSPFRLSEDGITAAVRLTPKAKANRVAGLADLGEGATALKVSVTAAPERGKANAALLGLLAKQWRLPKSALSLVAGATDRRKLVRIEGGDALLKRTLDDWLTRKHG
jgi:uncharacterized protein (TIGR00251 family)